MKKRRFFTLLVILLQCSFVVAQTYIKVFDYRKTLSQTLETKLAKQAVMVEELENPSLSKINVSSHVDKLKKLNAEIITDYNILCEETVYIMHEGIIINDERDRYSDEIFNLQEYLGELERFAEMENNIGDEEAAKIKTAIESYKNVIACSEDLLSQMDGLTGSNMLDKIQFANKRDKLEYCNEISAILFKKMEESIEKNYVLQKEDNDLFKKYHSIANYYREAERNDSLVLPLNMQRCLSLFDYATTRVSYSYFRESPDNDLYKKIENTYVNSNTTADFDFVYIELNRDMNGSTPYQKKLKDFEVSLYRDRFNKLRELDEERFMKSPLMTYIGERLVAGFMKNLFDIPSDVMKEAQKTGNPKLLYNYMR